jgi:hypothetical protein
LSAQRTITLPAPVGGPRYVSGVLAGGGTGPSTAWPLHFQPVDSWRTIGRLGRRGARGCLHGAFVLAFADSNELNETMVGTSPLLVTVLALSTTAVRFAVVALVRAVPAWRRQWWTLPGRLHYSAATLAAITFLGIATSYHLAIV